MSDTKYSLKKETKYLLCHTYIYIYCSCNIVPLTLLGLDNLFDVYLFMDFFVLLDTL